MVPVRPDVVEVDEPAFVGQPAADLTEHPVERGDVVARGMVDDEVEIARRQGSVLMFARWYARGKP